MSPPWSATRPCAGRAHRTPGGPAGGRGAHELYRGCAVGELVAHYSWDGQLGDRFLQRCLQAGGERDTRNRLVEESVFGVTLDPALELVRRAVFFFQAF